MVKKNIANSDQSINLDIEPKLAHLKEVTWRDGAEILADAANLLPGLGQAIKLSVGLGKYSPEERIKEKQFKWVLEQISNISEKLDKLLNSLPIEEQPEPADVAAIIEAAMETSRKTSGAKKRQLLKNAVVNAFDPEQYQMGLSLSFFSILQNVEYGEVELLSKLAENSEAIGVQSLSNQPNSLVYHHLELLNKLGLVLIWNRGQNPLGMDIQAYTRVSEFGRKFLGFVCKTDVDETNK